MKKSFTFYLKTAFLLIGFALIAYAGFTPVQSQSQFNGSENFEDIIEVSTIGIHHILWYTLVIGTAAVFSVGYFFNKIVNRVLVYVLVPLFTGIFLFFSAITSMTWGAIPFVPQLEYGWDLMVYGGLLVLTATLISVHRKTTKIVSGNRTDLLDEI